jgi:hypothetical protein
MGAIIWAVILTLVAGGATHCAALTRRDRNYWPMLRVLWAAIAFIYGGSGLSVLVSRRLPTTANLVFVAVALAAVAYSVWFMRKRNRTPRFIRLDTAGDVILRSVEELDTAANLAESWAAHGAMPEARVASLRAALAEWDAKRAWAREMASQARARRRARDAERGGIPDDDD